MSNHHQNSEIDRAVDALQKGLLVAFPTETVYGLGADASNSEALTRLYTVKGRPGSHPVIIHLASADQLPDWTSSIPEEARALAAAFWPGPMTLILPRAPRVLDQVTGGQPTVGVRVPKHPLTLMLLNTFGRGIAAPSANKFGRLSPTSAAHVLSEFKPSEVAVVLDGGSCDVGIESTIIDLSQQRVRILRPGVILLEQIHSVIGQAPDTMSAAATVRVPGSLASHYAPRTPLRLVNSDELALAIASAARQGQEVAVLSFQGVSGASTAIVARLDAEEYARHLYDNLRRLDTSGCDTIFVEQVPSDATWIGVSDRLSRAATGKE